MKSSIDFLDEACDPVDAAVFSGDVLCTEEGRTRLEYWMGRWQRTIGENRRSDEMELRRGTEVGKTKTCQNCEWGKFGPCRYLHWPFSVEKEDPACKDFQQWGLVF